MTGIAVYMEGGGDSTDSKATIRRGMAEFLREIRDRARSKKCHWRVVACGSRNAAQDAFKHAVVQNPATLNVLLVDSEGPVTATPRAHLKARDGWDLRGDEDRLHLMVQAMEAWIAADVDALRRYCSQGFRENALPKAPDLETVAKADVERALEHATRETQKGTYHKIHHASGLLAKIDPAEVRQRCRHCRRLFEVLTGWLEAA